MASWNRSSVRRRPDTGGNLRRRVTPSSSSTRSPRSEQHVAAVERRVGVREVDALVRAAALLARERGGGDQARQRERVAGQLAQALGVRRRPARRQSAARVASRRRRRAARPARRPPRSRGGAPARRAPPARRGGRGRSTRPASSTPAGWRRAARCRRIRRRRRGPAATRGRPGRSRRRPSCSGRPARPARGRARGSMPSRAQRVGDVGEPGHVDRPQVEPTERVPCSRSRPRPPAPPRRAAPARRRTARRRRPASSAPSPRTASVIRKPSRAPSLTSAVGWNCMNSRSASAAPAAWASARPTPTEPGGLVVRAHSAAAPPVARTVPRGAPRPARRPASGRPRPTQRPS